MTRKIEKCAVAPNGLLIIILVALAAFVVRLQVCRELAANDPQVSRPANCTDMFTYQSLSEKIVKGEYDGEFYYQPFYYSVFLPVVKYIFGFGVWPVILAQCLLSAFTVCLAGTTAKRLWNSFAGIAAAVLTALSTTLILYTAFHLIATLQAFWLALITYCCVDALSPSASAFKSSRRRAMVWGGIGLLTGMAILTRGNIWLMVPGIVFAIIAAEFTAARSTNSALQRTSLKKSFRMVLPAILFLAMTVLPQIPFVWHNTTLKGRLTAPSTAAGAVLCLGDTPESPPGGREAGSGQGPMEYPDSCKAWSAGNSTSKVVRHIIEWALDSPLAFLELQFRKCLLFWDYREIPNNIAIEGDGLRSRTLSTVGLLPTVTVKTPFGPREIIFLNMVPFSAAILILGLAGFLFSIHRLAAKILGLQARSNTLAATDANNSEPSRSKVNPNTSDFSRHQRRFLPRLPEALLLYFVAAYWLGTAAFYILARFRAPIIPLLAVLAGGFLFHVRRLLFRKRELAGKAAATAVVAVLFSGGIVLVGYNTYRHNFEAAVMRWARPDGTTVKLRDDTWMLKDNGPATFGGWRSVALKNGATISKRFVIPSNIALKAQPAATSNTNEKKTSVIITTLRLPVFWNSPGSAELSVNGEVFQIFSPSTPKPQTIERKIHIGNDGKVEIIVKRLDGELSLIIDAQRDYGRTMLDGHPIDAELVADLLLKKLEK